MTVDLNTIERYARAATESATAYGDFQLFANNVAILELIQRVRTAECSADMGQEWTQEFRAARERIASLEATLTAICSLGGNLPDERLTNRTGPNDAAQRGLMYCEARRAARETLEAS